MTFCLATILGTLVDSQLPYTSTRPAHSTFRNIVSPDGLVLHFNPKPSLRNHFTQPTHRNKDLTPPSTSSTTRLRPFYKLQPPPLQRLVTETQYLPRRRLDAPGAELPQHGGLLHSRPRDRVSYQIKSRSAKSTAVSTLPMSRACTNSTVL